MWASALGCLRRMKCFFPFHPSSHLLLPYPDEVYVRWFLNIFLTSLLSYFFRFWFGIHVRLRMSVTNCSQTLWQYFCFFPVRFLWPSFFPFLPFFLFFPSRSGASDAKEPRYGPLSPSLFFFFFLLCLFAFLTHSPPFSKKKKINLFAFCLVLPPTPVPPLPFLSRPYPAGSVSSHSLLCVSVCPSCAPHPCPVHWPSPRTCSTEGHCSCR